MIASKASKPKRGVTRFIIGGKEWYYYITTNSGNYLLYDNTGKLSEFQPDSLTVATKRRKEINRVSSKTSPTKSNTGLKNDPKSLDAFYLQLSYEVPFNCQECGKPLNAFNLWAKRCVSAHLLPKNDFPEIATVEANIMYMGVTLVNSGCGHHSNYDEKGAEYRSKMNIYDEVLNRYFNFLKQLLSVPQQVKAEKYLNIKS